MKIKIINLKIHEIIKFITNSYNKKILISKNLFYFITTNFLLTIIILYYNKIYNLSLTFSIFIFGKID